MAHPPESARLAVLSAQRGAQRPYEPPARPGAPGIGPPSFRAAPWPPAAELGQFRCALRGSGSGRASWTRSVAKAHLPSLVGWAGLGRPPAHPPPPAKTL